MSVPPHKSTSNRSSSNAKTRTLTQNQPEHIYIYIYICIYIHIQKKNSLLLTLPPDARAAAFHYAFGPPGVLICFLCFFVFPPNDTARHGIFSWPRGRRLPWEGWRHRKGAGALPPKGVWQHAAGAGTRRYTTGYPLSTSGAAGIYVACTNRRLDTPQRTTTASVPLLRRPANPQLHVLEGRRHVATRGWTARHQ